LPQKACPALVRRIGAPRFRIGCAFSKPEPRRHSNMGDKSPKAKDKNKKQDSAAKNQKKTNASNKAGAVNAASKKGK